MEELDWKQKYELSIIAKIQRREIKYIESRLYEQQKLKGAKFVI